VNILDVFYFLFESDASKLDEGLAHSDKQSKQLGDTLNKTDKAADMLGKHLVDAVKSAASLGASFLAFHSLKSMVFDVAESTRQLGLNAQQAKVSAEQYSAWTQAAELAGGTAEGFARSLEALSRYGRDPIETLKQIQGRFEGLSKIQAQRLGERFGLDIGTINLLQMGGKALDEFIAKQKELGVVTKEQVEISTKFVIQQRMTNLVFEDIKRRLAVAVMPYLTEFFKLLEKILMWMRNNSAFMTKFFVSLGVALSGILVPALVRATIATIAFLAPWMALIAVAAAAALIWDDFNAYLNGHASVIGELAKKYPLFKEAIDKVVEVFKYLKEWIGIVADFLSDVFTKGFSAALETAGASMDKFLDKLEKRFPKTAQALRWFGEAAASAAEFASKAWEVYFNWVQKVFNFVVDKISKIPEIWQKFKDMFNPESGAVDLPQIENPLTNNAQQQLAMMSRNPLLPQTSSSITNMATARSQQNSISIDKIDVITEAKDANEVAQNISDALKLYINSAIYQHDDGLMA